MPTDSGLTPFTVDHDHSMKPLLAVAIKEAVKLALVDSCDALTVKHGRDLAVGDRLHEPLICEPGRGWEEARESLMESIGNEFVEKVEGCYEMNANGVISEVAQTYHSEKLLTLDDCGWYRFRAPVDQVFIVRRELTDEERAKMQMDEYAGPQYVDFDPGALAQNVCCRLLGTGGWNVGGIYAGNATDRDVFDASIIRPDRSRIDELAMDMGLRPEDDDE
jgi:hypothetical protein